MLILKPVSNLFFEILALGLIVLVLVLTRATNSNLIKSAFFRKLDLQLKLEKSKIKS